MRRESLIIGFIIAITFIVIWYLNNKKDVEEWVKKNKCYKVLASKCFLTCCGIGVTVIIVFYAFINMKSINIIINNNRIYKANKEKNDETDYICFREKQYIKNSVKEMNGQNCMQPYIPEGFYWVEGNVEEGYVIEDQKHNQFVWVPCTNVDDKEDKLAYLEKRNENDEVLVYKDQCYDENYEKFIDSACENGGFYISRFEVGLENEENVIKKDAELIRNKSKEEFDKIVKSFEVKDMNVSLINGLAMDTTLDWLKETNEIRCLNVKNELTNKVYSGRQEYNNIYDLYDNVFEVTYENFYDLIIIRGIIKNQDYHDFDNYESATRYPVSIDELGDEANNVYIIAARMIMYK